MNQICIKCDNIENNLMLRPFVHLGKSYTVCSGLPHGRGHLSVLVFFVLVRLTKIQFEKLKK